MTKPIVIDSSVALSWTLDDETTNYSKEILQSVSDYGAVVPILWKIEVGNGLWVAKRKKRVDEAGLARAFRLCENLIIETDAETLPKIWPSTFNIANHYNLTIYDATYLELALRRNLPLATYDKDLRKAATTAGVHLL